MAATASGWARLALDTIEATGSPGMSRGISQLIVTAAKNVSP
jgi:hypothetical protein